MDKELTAKIIYLDKTSGKYPFKALDLFRWWHKTPGGDKKRSIEGVTLKSGIPHVWGVPCIKEVNYKLFYSEFSENQEWLCPHCLCFMSTGNKQVICSNGCHLRNDPAAKSAFIGGGVKTKIPGFFRSLLFFVSCFILYLMN